MTDPALSHRLQMVEYQCTVILVLSALNLFANLATIAAAVWIAWL